MTGLPLYDVGQHVILEWHEGGEADRRFDSEILLVDDHRLIVQVENPRVLPQAPFCNVISVTKSGIYYVEATVASDTDATVALELTSEVNKIQRRQYVRVDHALDVNCLLLNEETNLFTNFAAKVRDISGGGVALEAGTIAPQGATIVISLALPGEKPFVLVGEVLATDDQVEQIRSGSQHGFQLRVQFRLITESDRDRLMRFVFVSLTG